MSNPNKLPILEVFGPTIQGEGAMIGRQTTFIRSVHCDYACSRCDSMHAVDPAQYKGKEKTVTAQTLMDALMEIQGDCKWVTITGGNPALWDFSEFVELAHDKELLVNVETQGSKWKDWLAGVDMLTISPKGPGMGINAEISLQNLQNFFTSLEGSSHYYTEACIKIPVFSTEDLDFAEEVQKLCNKGDLGEISEIYLSVGNMFYPGSEEAKDVTMYGLRDSLLGTMSLMYDFIRVRPLLANAIVLPQLHVLLWGNKQLV